MTENSHPSFFHLSNIIQKRIIATRLTLSTSVTVHTSKTIDIISIQFPDTTRVEYRLLQQKTLSIRYELGEIQEYSPGTMVTIQYSKDEQDLH